MFLAFFLWLGLFLFAVLDCLAADPARCRGLPKLMWIPVIALLPIVGPSAWLMFGRPLKLPENGRPPRHPKRPLGPDDDPRFLEMTGGPARGAPPRRRPEADASRDAPEPAALEPGLPGEAPKPAAREIHPPREATRPAAGETHPPAPQPDPAAGEHGVNDLSRWEKDLVRREEDLRRKLENLPPEQG